MTTSPGPMSYEELLPGLDSASPFSTMSSASFDSAIGDMFGAALTPSTSGKVMTQSHSHTVTQSHSPEKLKHILI